MRRIYESEALRRDDNNPHTPHERETARPQAFRSIDAGALSRRIVPDRLRHWAISVDVSTSRAVYPSGARIPFTVEMRNAMPFPITVATLSPLLWDWSVDGLPEASHVETHDVPDERGGFEFDRGERKRFRKHWDGMFRTGEAEWERAEPGEYTIGAGLNVEDPTEAGLYDETTVRLEPD
jgi:hypothetical protein